MTNDEEFEERARAAREAATRFLHWHGRRTSEDHLAALREGIETDRYGAGGVVEELEKAVTELLDKPAAVFMPSGTMAQQIALRIHADRRGRPTVVFHPTSHLELHELKAYQYLHQLIGRPVGDAHRPLDSGDLHEVAESPAALLLELPQREIGGTLPDWEELQAQTAWARERGAAVHLDGARLWECGPYYQRPLSEIAAVFDTVYVSFYKGLGALAGCLLLGEPDVIDEAREWRARHGGTLFALWPYAASALRALETRLVRMPAYFERAVALAAALADLPDVELVPDPPVTPMMHLHLRTDATAFREQALEIAERDGVWTWERSWPTATPAWQRVELVVGDATMDFTPEEVRDLIRQLVAVPSRVER